MVVIEFFLAIVKSIGDDGLIQVQVIKNGMLLYRQIHPRQIIEIHNQSMTF